MVLLLAIAILQASTLCAQPAFDIEYVEKIRPLHYVAQRALAPLLIDGKLDEPSWQRAPWTPAFVDIEGERKERPHLATRAKMLWDDEDRKSTRLNSSHSQQSRMPSSA